MKRVAVIFLLFALAASQKPACPRNQEYKDCGSRCPPTCNKPKPQVCIALCVAGCACKDGYMKDDKGNCVRPNDCPGGSPHCDINEEYVPCPNPCPPTCDRQDPILCKAMCLPYGCQCKKGYVKDANGRCILPKQCPRTTTMKPTPTSTPNCGRNAVYISCPNPCAPTCQQQTPPKVCTRMCLRFGCQCRDGYVRNSNNQCVLPKQCPPTSGHKCPINEVWSDAACVRPPCAQQPQCPNNKPLRCAGTCKVGGCICRKEFMRNQQGICVPPGRCNKPFSVGDPIEQGSDVAEGGEGEGSES